MAKTQYSKQGYKGFYGTTTIQNVKVGSPLVEQIVGLAPCRYGGIPQGDVLNIGDAQILEGESTTVTFTTSMPDGTYYYLIDGVGITVEDFDMLPLTGTFNVVGGVGTIPIQTVINIDEPDANIADPISETANIKVYSDVGLTNMLGVVMLVIIDQTPEYELIAIQAGITVGNNIYVYDLDNIFVQTAAATCTRYSFDGISFTPFETFNTSGNIGAIHAIGGSLYLGTTTGRIHILDFNLNQLNLFVVTGNNVEFIGHNGTEFFYCARGANGGLYETPDFVTNTKISTLNQARQAAFDGTYYYIAGYDTDKIEKILKNGTGSTTVAVSDRCWSISKFGNYLISAYQGVNGSAIATFDLNLNPIDSYPIANGSLPSNEIYALNGYIFSQGLADGSILMLKQDVFEASGELFELQVVAGSAGGRDIMPFGNYFFTMNTTSFRVYQQIAP